MEGLMFRKTAGFPRESQLFSSISISSIVINSVDVVKSEQDVGKKVE